MRNAAGQVLASDVVKMKVAPWVMLSNQEASTEVWATKLNTTVNPPDYGNEKFRLNAQADAGYKGLDNSGQLQTYDLDDAKGNGQWTQDHAEIGYTQRPGGSKIYEVFQLPYGGLMGPQPAWLKQMVLGPTSGVFQIGDNMAVNGLNPDSGDFGGNLELLPPNATNKLGRIVVGDTMSAELQQFLTSQEVQASPQLVVLPAKWLNVGHIDEVLTFDRVANKVIIADPTDAYTLLNNIPAADRGKSVFFAPGNTQAGTVPADSNVNATKRIETGIDLTGKNANDWRYIRIYDDAASGSTAKGQIARISTWGNGFVEVDKVWDTTSKITIPNYPQNRATQGQSFFKWTDPKFDQNNQSGVPAPSQATWFRNPKKNDKFVLLQDTLDLKWFNGTPMAVTVQEVLADGDFDTLNRTRIKAKIDDIKSLLDTAAGGAGTLTFISVPDLYFGLPDQTIFATARRAYAFAPGLANAQIIGDSYYFPRSFAPLDATGKDIFEEAVKSRINNALFVDDWTTYPQTNGSPEGIGFYHTNYGEVHCGSLVKRAFWNKDWWNP